MKKDIGKIKEEEISHLKDAVMEYPTWECFKDIIEEAKENDFPSKHFGTEPLSNGNKLISVTATQEIGNKIKGQYVGIDVPVLLRPEKGGNGNTIIIVGESPLRDKKVFNNPDILLGTPYAIHQMFNCPSQCNVYKKIFSDLLGNNYSVYLTDIIKIWWEGKKLNVYKSDENLFNQEFEKLSGKKVIVAWGKRAKEKLEKMGRQFIQLPHPSQQNWNNWKLRIFEKAVYHKGEDYAKKLYPDEEFSTTSEVIVANEAVKEILESDIVKAL